MIFNFGSAVLLLSSFIYSHPNGSPICMVDERQISASAMLKSDPSLGYKFMVKYAGNYNWDITIQNSAGRKDFTGILLYVHQYHQPQKHLGQISFQDTRKWKYMSLQTCNSQRIISSTPKSTITQANDDPVLISPSLVFRWTASREELALPSLVVNGAIATNNRGASKWQHLQYYGISPIPMNGTNSAAAENSRTAVGVNFSSIGDELDNLSPTPTSNITGTLSNPVTVTTTTIATTTQSSGAMRQSFTPFLISLLILLF